MAENSVEKTLLSLPPELVASALALLGVPSLAACAQVSVVFLRGDEQPQPGAAPATPPRLQGLVEQALRLRAARTGCSLPVSLPEGETSWVKLLLWCARAKKQTVAVGGEHTLLIAADGQLLSCGDLSEERCALPLAEHISAAVLGHGKGVDFMEVPWPVLSLQGVRIITVAASVNRSLAVSEAGGLYSWGHCWLGHGGAPGSEDDTRYVPALVAALSAARVCDVAASYTHSLAVTDAGTLYSWGRGSSREWGWPPCADLGHGDDQDQCVPKRVDAMHERVSFVAAGSGDRPGGHSLAVARSGALYSWGFGEYGTLGHGDRQSCALPKRVEGLQELVCSVAASAKHNLAVTISGALYSWGDGGDGRLGHGDEEDQLLPRPVEAIQGPVRSVAAGYDCHSLAITSSGALYTWGAGAHGRLGHGDEEDRLLPKRMHGLQEERVCAVAAGEAFNVAVANNGRAWGWGCGDSGLERALGLQLQPSTEAFSNTESFSPLEYAQLRVASQSEFCHE